MLRLAWLGRGPSSRDVRRWSHAKGYVPEMRHKPLADRRRQRRSVGAAPARGVRCPAPGTPREPIGRHYDRSARSSLDWDWRQCLVPGNADPGKRNRRDGAPAGARTSATVCGKTYDWCAIRRSIPSAFCRREKPDDGLPGAAKNTGDGARLRQTARHFPASPIAHSSALRSHFARSAAAS